MGGNSGKNLINPGIFVRAELSASSKLVTTDKLQVRIWAMMQKELDMDPKLIKRINELARKSKTTGLSELETEERDRLRKQYMKQFREQFRIQLESIKFTDESDDSRDSEGRNGPVLH